jgi:regulator of replication initiation timing
MHENMADSNSVQVHEHVQSKSPQHSQHLQHVQTPGMIPGQVQEQASGWVSKLFSQMHMMQGQINHVNWRLVREIKHLHEHLYTNIENTGDMVQKSEALTRRLRNLKTERENSKRELIEIKTCWMGDNLIHVFTKVLKAEGEINEQTEAALRKFLTEKRRMSKKSTKLIGFQRV